MTPEQKTKAAANLVKARAAKAERLAAEKAAGSFADPHGVHQEAQPEAASSAAIQTLNAPPSAGPAPALDVAALLKAIALMTPEERAAVASVISPQTAPPPAAARVPPGANPYEYLPLESALKEALFEMGAVDRRTSAVRTSKLAEHIVSRGFPKSRGRTYEGDEHSAEVCTHLKLIIEQNKRAGIAGPLSGWFNYVGGQAAGSPDNFEWSVPQSAIGEAVAQGRVIPAPPAAAPAETPLRPHLPGGGPYAEDLLPGTHSADQVMASMPKLERQELGRVA